MTDRRNEGVAGMERHISVIGIALILAILAWAGNSILEQGKMQVESQAKVEGTINVISVEIKHLKEMFQRATLDRYTASDAARDRANCRSRMDVLTKRVDRLEDIHNRNASIHGGERIE